MSENIITKTCRICKTTKPIDEYYKATNYHDGYRNECKQCHYVVMKRYCQTDKGKAREKRYNVSEKGKSRAKQYEQSPKGKIAQKRYEQSEKGILLRKQYSQSERGKVSSCVGSARYRVRYPERQKAVSAVHNAIRAGKLPPPTDYKCKKCFTKAQEYHHWSYAQIHWLHVMPFCKVCHKKIHSEQRFSHRRRCVYRA